jgi:hypothetical protein
MKLQEMSYEEFAKLKFLNFFPKTSDYSFDDLGAVSTGIGYACTDGYGQTFFASKSKAKGKTCEILLDFENLCPEKEGHALLDKLGLKLRRGMSYNEIKAFLGVPVGGDKKFSRYVIGRVSPFYVSCSLNKDGLFKVWICRKDLADKNLL